MTNIKFENFFFLLPFLFVSCIPLPLSEIDLSIQESVDVTENDTSTDDTSASSSSLIVPEGIVLAFNLATCPTGWSEFSNGKGRVLVGSGIGNLDDLTNALSLRVLSSTGGLEYKTAYAYNTSSAANSPAGANSLLASVTGADTIYQGGRHTTNGLGGAVADSNLPPFKALLYCYKTATESSIIPSGATVSKDISNCSGDWSPASDFAGRTVLGSGSGNTDRNSAALSARSNGDTGGREGVKGMPISSGAPFDSVAIFGAGIYPAMSAPDTIYSSTLSAQCLGSDGCLDNPNLPPFLALNFCQLSSSSTNGFPTNTVAPFNTACPTGWSSYNTASGRIIIGTGSGNIDMDGAALTARSLGETGGWEQTNSIPLGGTATLTTPSGNWIGNITGGDTIFAAGTPGGYTDTIADSNMPPFVVVNYCIKN